MGDVVELRPGAAGKYVRRELARSKPCAGDLQSYISEADDFLARHADLVRMRGAPICGDAFEGWSADVCRFFADIAAEPAGIRCDSVLLERVLKIKGHLSMIEFFDAKGGENVDQADRRDSALMDEARAENEKLRNNLRPARHDLTDWVNAGLIDIPKVVVEEAIPAMPTRFPPRVAAAERGGQGAVLSPGLAACSAVFHFRAGFDALAELIRALAQAPRRRLRAAWNARVGLDAHFGWMNLEKPHDANLRERRKPDFAARVSHIREGVMRKDRADFLPEDDFPKGAA